MVAFSTILILKAKQRIKISKKIKDFKEFQRSCSFKYISSLYKIFEIQYFLGIKVQFGQIHSHFDQTFWG
jgi:hypothetical protein